MRSSQIIRIVQGEYAACAEPVKKRIAALRFKHKVKLMQRVKDCRRWRSRELRSKEKREIL